MPMGDFWANYAHWQQNCLEELRTLGYQVNSENVEICEDGSVHFKGNFYLTDPLVTPWKNSQYYDECLRY